MELVSIYSIKQTYNIILSLLRNEIFLNDLIIVGIYALGKFDIILKRKHLSKFNLIEIKFSVLSEVNKCSEKISLVRPSCLDDSS